MKGTTLASITALFFDDFIILWVLNFKIIVVLTHAQDEYVDRQ
jgi:hypothetical protein